MVHLLALTSIEQYCDARRPFGLRKPPHSGSGARTRGRGLTLEHAGQVVPGGGLHGAALSYPSTEVVCGHGIRCVLIPLVACLFTVTISPITGSVPIYRYCFSDYWQRDYLPLLSLITGSVPIYLHCA